MPLTPGDPVPWFVGRASCNPRFHVDTMAGRCLVLFFFPTAANPGVQVALQGFLSQQGTFDNRTASFLGITGDPQDELQVRLQGGLPGCHFLWDADRDITSRYSVATAGCGSYEPATVIVDAGLRVVDVVRWDSAPAAHVDQVLRVVERHVAESSAGCACDTAPILIVPRIFEPEFCRELIGLYERHGGEESGFVRDVNGRTVTVVDYGHKRRRDHVIANEGVIRQAQVRLHRRLVPQIQRAFQFHATRIERHIVACYEAEAGGHFRPHRDNTTRGTAHRRFAVSLQLNSEYAGGDLRFPEFGQRTYRAPVGGAVVFSCSLLHEATPVTSGRRYVFLPFLYDDAAAKIREANQAFVDSQPNVQLVMPPT